MTKHPLTAAKAEAWFAVYYGMGPGRSLEKLVALRTQLGLKGACLNTLKRWSVDFGWQARIVELDAKAQERTDELMAGDVAAMNLRQANLGRAMQQVAGKRIDIWDEVPSALGASDVARMAEVGAKLERLAMGEATERREVMLSLLNVVIRPMCDLFSEINSLADEIERLRRFADGADRIVDTYLSAGRA